MTEQLVLFPVDHADPINPRDQWTRIPGTDAPCFQGLEEGCQAPWCTCYAQEEDEAA